MLNKMDVNQIFPILGKQVASSISSKAAYS